MKNSKMRKGLLLVIILMLLPVGMWAKKFTLVIDAGHGGHDAGAIGAITKEKTINLNVAMAFGRLVERNCPDVKVVYTRKTDVFIPLHTRADIANKNKADLFISIHTNSVPKGRTVRGLETYTLGMHRAADNLDVAKRENSVILIEKDYKQRYQGFDPNSSESYIMFEFIQDQNMAQSVELAKYVQKRTCASAGRQNKGVKQAGFLVLRETSMPSCLIELGFISTPDEERFLNSADGVASLGQGIYQAFLDYKQKHDSGNAAPARNQMVKELADAREGRIEEPRKVSEPRERTINADSIINATPTVPQMVAEAPKPVETPNPIETPIPVAQKPAEPLKPVEALKPVEPQPKPDTTPKVVETPKPVAAPVSNAPVFKVQIMASGYKLKNNDPQLKGVKNADFYQEGGFYKYTVGASENYNDIAQLRKTLTDRFPQAFIIAFKNGQKTDVQSAIREFKNKK